MNSEHPASTALLAFLASELAQNRGLGDYQTMLAAVWNKRKRPDLIQPNKQLPVGYRSTVMPEYVFRKFGTRLLRWGATAIRGDLTEKKAHISRFIELVNDLPGDITELEEVFDSAAKMVADYITARSPLIKLPSASTAQQVLNQLLKTKSQGRVQQGLVYALLKVLNERDSGLTVRTKVVFAGDAQSRQRGDVDVIQNDGAIRVVFEVKAQQLDALTYESVVRTHTGTGTRDYPVFILAESFKANLEGEYQDVFTVRLRDFCLTILAEIVSTKALTSNEVIRHILEVYNNDFCHLIQHDPTLRVDY